MTTFANTLPQSAVDGKTYVSAVAIPSSEGDLLSPASPVPVLYEGMVSASVQIVIPASVSTNTGTYIVLQGDMNDSNWVDLAWCQVASGTTTAGTYGFLLSAGSWQAASAVQTRASGTVPTGNSANQAVLPARLRWVGKNNTDKAPTVTIIYKLQGFR